MAVTRHFFFLFKNKVFTLAFTLFINELFYKSVEQTFYNYKSIKQDKLVYKSVEQTFYGYKSIEQDKLIYKSVEQTFLCFYLVLTSKLVIKSIEQTFLWNFVYEFSKFSGWGAVVGNDTNK